MDIFYCQPDCSANRNKISALCVRVSEAEDSRPTSHHWNGIDHGLVKRCRYESFRTSGINRSHEQGLFCEQTHLRAIWANLSGTIYHQLQRFRELRLEAGLDNQSSYFFFCYSFHWILLWLKKKQSATCHRSHANGMSKCFKKALFFLSNLLCLDATEIIFPQQFCGKSNLPILPWNISFMFATGLRFNGCRPCHLSK